MHIKYYAVDIEHCSRCNLTTTKQLYTLMVFKILCVQSSIIYLFASNLARLNNVKLL